MESSIAERKEKYDKMLSSLQASVEERKKSIKAQQADNEHREKANAELELSLGMIRRMADIDRFIYFFDFFFNHAL
jgi:hypothetical protein